jgi:hypothetical protein
MLRESLGVELVLQVELHLDLLGVASTELACQLAA